MHRSVALLAFLPFFSALTLADVDPNTLPNNTLPAANLTSDPIDRNITVVQLPLEPSATGVPSFTNETTPDAGLVQTVAYFPVSAIDTDLAIIHGDIILSTVDDLLVAADNSSSSETRRSLTRRALSIFRTQNVWPNGVISYKWASEEAKGLGRLEAWTEATGRWTNMLPWLVFQEFPENDTLVEDIVTLTPTTGQFACFSPIGKSYGAYSNQIMLDDQCGGAGTYAHELGHTLGLYHEHMRPDRDDYITIHCENVWLWNGQPADCSQSCSGYGCNFAKLDPAAADWSGPYDVLSLMHYAEYEFSNGNGPVLTPLPGVPAPLPHSFPTALDAKRVCELYREECTGVCGNGVVEAGEECDDGNNFAGDGCSASCKSEDGHTDPPTPGDCTLETCDPWSATSCDTTTTCTALGGAVSGGMGQHLCACRHGYRANGYAANDTSAQVRLPWLEQEGRVFVKPGIVCDTLCDDYTQGKDGCKAVAEVDACY